MSSQAKMSGISHIDNRMNSPSHCVLVPFSSTTVIPCVSIDLATEIRYFINKNEVDFYPKYGRNSLEVKYNSSNEILTIQMYSVFQIDEFKSIVNVCKRRNVKPIIVK